MPRAGVKRVSAAMACILKDRLLILSDTAINIEPDADTLAEMAIQAAETAESLFDLQPKVALISFSNFGSVNHPEPDKVAAAGIIPVAEPQAWIDERAARGDGTCRVIDGGNRILVIGKN